MYEASLCSCAVRSIEYSPSAVLQVAPGAASHVRPSGVPRILDTRTMASTNSKCRRCTATSCARSLSLSFSKQSPPLECTYKVGSPPSSLHSRCGRLGGKHHLTQARTPFVEVQTPSSFPQTQSQLTSFLPTVQESPLKRTRQGKPSSRTPFPCQPSLLPLSQSSACLRSSSSAFSKCQRSWIFL